MTAAECKAAAKELGRLANDARLFREKCNLVLGSAYSATLALQEVSRVAETGCGRIGPLTMQSAAEWVGLKPKQGQNSNSHPSACRQFAMHLLLILSCKCLHCGMQTSLHPIRGLQSSTMVTTLHYVHLILLRHLCMMLCCMECPMYAT